MLSTNYRTFAFSPLDAELNPICHLLALLGAHHILRVSRVRVKRQNTHFLLSSSLYIQARIGEQRQLYLLIS